MPAHYYLKRAKTPLCGKTPGRGDQKHADDEGWRLPTAKSWKGDYCEKCKDKKEKQGAPK